MIYLIRFELSKLLIRAGIWIHPEISRLLAEIEEAQESLGRIPTIKITSD